MKLKKYSYILVFILMLIIGINNAYADSKKECFYMSGDDKLKIQLFIGYDIASPGTATFKDFAEAKIWKTGEGKTPISSHRIENWWAEKDINGTNVGKIYEDRNDANSQTNPTCPKYVIYTSCPGGFFGLGTTDAVFAINSSSIASSAINASKECDYAGYASNYKDGKQITEDMFFTEFVADGLIEYDESKDSYTCADMDSLFGSKNDPESIRYMVNEVLGAIRIIAPILIILFGTIDFAKAVIAGKQDNMKKAQSDFIKRIIAGVAIFLIPTLVDIIMGLADIVWQGEYVHCDF